MEREEQRVSRREVLARAAEAAAVVAAAGRSTMAAEPLPPALLGWNQYLIWDVHGHLSFPGATARQRMENTLRYADRMSIARLIVFMGYPWSQDPSPDELRRQNDQVLDVVAHAGDRVWGFVYVNPKHTDASLQEMDRCVRDGPLLGVKLWVAAHCHEEILDPIVRRAVELKAPVLQHTWYKITGNLPGESTAAELATLARRHPDASFIAAHTGGDWERGIRAIRATENVVAEVCGGDPTAGFVEMAVRELGPQRVVYGSDYAGRSFASQLSKVLGADVSEQAKRLILAGNIQRILQPICSAKGFSL